MNFSETLYNKIRVIFKNPIILFLTISIVLCLFLLIKTNLQLVDFYTDRNAAEEFVHTLDPHFDMKIPTAKFGNPEHKIYNFIFKMFAASLSLLLFSLVFKIKNWSNFKDIKLIKNKAFIFTWINLAYILMCNFHMLSYMANIEKYVYHSAADSFGIPYFTELFICLFFSIAYYPLVNLLFFGIYKTRIDNIFYTILCALAILIFGLYALKITFLRIFIWQDILGYLYIAIWIAILANAIKTLNYKRKDKQNESTSC